MNKIVKIRIRIMLITFGVLSIMGFASIIFTMVDDQETTSEIPLPEYDNLFTKDTQAKLKILVTVKSRNRLPNSNYIYDNKYDIYVSKVLLLKHLPLKNIINYQNESSNKSLFAVYEGLPSHNFDMSLKAGKSVIVSNVHLKSSGDSVKSIVKNDSLYCYYYKFKSFSIRYNNEPYNIIANANVSDIPASVIFEEKGKFLYVILMTVAENNVDMQPDQLYRMIHK